MTITDKESLDTLIETTVHWLDKEYREPIMDPYDMLRFVEHFDYVKKLGYEILIEEPDRRHYHVSLIENGEKLLTKRYGR